MKHRLFIQTSMTILFVGFFVGVISSHARAATVFLPNPPNLATNATFTWKDMANITGTFPGGVTIDFEDVHALSDYYGGAAAGAYTSTTDTCASRTSNITVNARLQPGTGTIGLVDEITGVVNGSCQTPSTPPITIKSTGNAKIMYTFSGDQLVRVDGQPYSFTQDSTHTNLYLLDSGTPGNGSSTCTDRILYNADGSGVVYELTSGSGGNLPAAIYAAGCVISGANTDVATNPFGSAQQPPTDQYGGFKIFISGTPAPPGGGGGGGGGGTTNLNCGTGSSSNFSATSNDSCLMPQCEFSITNPITWFICPIVWAGEKLVGQLDNGINGMLNVNTCQYFYDINTKACSDTTNCGSGATSSCAETSTAFQTAWSSFRDIALSIVVIASLVMIISQAVGVEAVSAYSFKKMMPRLVIVIIGISLSWYILEFAVQLSDDLGNGIRFLIYSPFSGLLATNKAILSGGGQAVTALVISGAGLALGIVGLLTLVLTAAIAVVIGFGLLLVRNLAIIVLIILAPIGIACYALPNTERIWKLWSSNFTKVLLMFPIIAAFIASGRVLSAIIYTNDNSTLDQLMAFVVYFAPYFMIPTAFKLAGGFMATAGNIAGNLNTRARRVGSGVAKGQVAKNWNNMKSGNRFAGGNEQNWRGRYNRALKSATLLPKAGLKPKDFKTKMRQNMRDSDAPELDSVLKGENRSFNAFSGDDAKLYAAKFNSAEQVEQGLATFDPGRFAGEANRASREEARVQIMQAKREVSSSVFQKARIRAMAKTGTGYQYTDENGQTQFGADRMMEDINSAYGDDRNGAGQALAEMRTSLQQSGQMAGAAGYGSWAGNMEALYHDNSAAMHKQVHESVMDDAINSVTPGQAIYGKPSSAAAMGAAHARRIQKIAESISTGEAIDMGRKDSNGNSVKEVATQEHLSTAMAGAAGIYDAMNQASPGNASAFANELMSKEVGPGITGADGKSSYRFTNPDGTSKNGTVREYIETQMANDPAFVNRRRDISRSAIEEAENRQRQQQNNRPFDPTQDNTGGGSGTTTPPIVS
jgi:hypothetical protein